MAEDGVATATFTKGADHIEARMSRALQHPAETVWRALTAADMLPLWLAPGTIDARPGGAVKLDFKDSGMVIDSAVTAFSQGSLLEYSWGGPGDPERPVRFALEPSGEAACTLTVSLKTPLGEDAGRGCAGWEAHLEMLEAALEGVPIKFPFETFKAARDAYRARLGG